MRDDWVGDEADFLKLGWLRYLHRRAGAHLPLGVVWYYRGGSASHRADEPPPRPTNARWRALDAALFDELASLHVDGRRELHAVVRAGLLPETVAHYSAPLVLPGTQANRSVRNTWHQAALDATAHCQTVFLDPDNGIQPGAATTAVYSSTRLPHALWAEIASYWERGQSLVLFQHAARTPGTESQYRDALRHNLGGADVWSLRRGARWLYVVAQPAHRSALEHSVGEFREAWSPFLRADAFAAE